MTSSSRIIKGDQLSDELVNWNAPEVDVSTVVHHVADDDPADDPVAIRQQAWQQGFDQGHADGIAAGLAELQQRGQLLQQVLDATAKPLQSIDQQVEQEILQLITEIARQLVRRELRLDSSHVIALIREGLAALPAGAAGIRVRLNPQDVETVRELLQPDEGGRAWTIEPDPLLEQGACRIVSETAQIDERLDTRLARVIATMLEDERAATE
ncbi:MAG: hypothetical protein HKN56_08395 [Gammaproteobacteria bacterium]|nr:hypothetical protein [Gammaproteobacteria bacterium]